MLRTVVGLVLAAMLLKVRELDKYDDEEWESDGDGGALGGRGRNDASSSASRTLTGDHMESRAREEEPVNASTLSSCMSTLLAIESFRDIVLRPRLLTLVPCL